MPVVEHKTTIEITASGVTVLLLVALAVFGVVLFVNGYLSLGFLCISVIGIIGSI